MEIELGILRIERRDPSRAATLRSWLEKGVLVAFGERILAIDLAVARRRDALHIPDPRSPIRARLHDRGDGACSWHDGRHPEHSRFRRDRCILAQSLERSRLTGARVIVRDDACATAIGNDAPIRKSITTFLTASIVRNGLRNSGPGCAAPPACPARARRNRCRNWSAFACRGCCWRSGMLRSCFLASRSSR